MHHYSQLPRSSGPQHPRSQMWLQLAIGDDLASQTQVFSFINSSSVFPNQDLVHPWEMMMKTISHWCFLWKQVSSVIQHLLFPVDSWIYLYSTYLYWFVNNRRTQTESCKRIEMKDSIKETPCRVTHFHFCLLNYSVYSELVNKSVQINVVHLRKRAPSWLRPENRCISLLRSACSNIQAYNL